GRDAQLAGWGVGALRVVGAARRPGTETAGVRDAGGERPVAGVDTRHRHCALPPMFGGADDLRFSILHREAALPLAPSPLVGEGWGGGRNLRMSSWPPPSLSLPHKGGGNAVALSRHEPRYPHPRLRMRLRPVSIATMRFSRCSTHISRTPSTCTTARTSTACDDQVCSCSTQSTPKKRSVICIQPLMHETAVRTSSTTAIAAPAGLWPRERPVPPRVRRQR